MIIRKAEKKDIPDLMRLLSQVLEIHAAIRPDIFVAGTTKYTKEELEAVLIDNGHNKHSYNDHNPVFIVPKKRPYIIQLLHPSLIFRLQR